MDLEYTESLTHEGSNLIADLGIVIVCAALVSIIFHRLRLPVILGYLLTGLLLGPHFLAHSPIHDLETVHELSVLGVIFLLFSIGMEFELKRLQRVIGPAFLAVVLQTLWMIFFAMLSGPILGWDTITSLFLGCLLAISSSMVTFTVLRDQNRLRHSHAQLAIGILILEDILAVMMLVVLTGVSVTGYLDWSAVWLVTFGVGVFVVVVYIFGKLAAPRILRILNQIGSLELITIFSVGFVLGISVLAQKFHFSVALGAFLAGAIISQSQLIKSIEQSTLPLRDIFGALFFVTMGMLIDPFQLLHYGGWILLLSVLVVAGKVVTCWAGLFLSGQPSRSSFSASVVKCQIGEFSFIIAELGHTLGVTDERLTTLAVGVSLLTILATPLLGLHSEKIFEGMARRTPETILLFARFYHNLLDVMQSVFSSNALLRLLKRPLLQSLIYFFLINGVIILAYLAAKFTEQRFMQGRLANYEIWFQSSIWLLAALAVLPGLIALLRNLNAMVMLLTEAAFRTTSNRPFLQGRMRNTFNTLVLFIVLLLVGGIFLSAAARYFPSGMALILFLGLILIAVLFFWRHMTALHSRLEFMFMESFNQQSLDHEEQRRESVLKEIAEKYPWPIKLHEVTIADGTVACGKRILDLHLREQTGCTILALGRQGYHTFDPSPELPLFPGDRLILLGSETQHDRADHLFNTRTAEDQSPCDTRFEVEQIYLTADSLLVGNTLARANLRRQYGITVIGIQRGAERITAPSPDEILKVSDVLFVVGNPEAIRECREAK